VSWFSEKLGAKASVRVSAPLARKDDLVVEDFGEEVLIYDQRTDQAHCLSRDAAMVWRVCDGNTSAAGLASALEMEPDTVSAAIDQLEAAGLLETLPVSGVTRREATIKMAKVGGAAAAAPMIYSILAPTPALASSQTFCLSLSCTPGCSDPTQCCCQTTGGCGTCHKNGCACCGPGNSTSTGENKICTADCSSTYCTPQIVNAHCNTQGTTSACNT
jgi:hypothetical protein